MQIAQIVPLNGLFKSSDFLSISVNNKVQLNIAQCDDNETRALSKKPHYLLGFSAFIRKFLWCCCVSQLSHYLSDNFSHSYWYREKKWGEQIILCDCIDLSTNSKAITILIRRKIEPKKEILMLLRKQIKIDVRLFRRIKIENEMFFFILFYSH